MQMYSTTDCWQLLESMPPIEVFAGVDTRLYLSEEVPPGLPTHEQLNHWLVEHDRIEKETEIFDAEDMSKLKKLTKGAFSIRPLSIYIAEVVHSQPRLNGISHRKILT